jgi:hypothetical protein
MQMQMFQIMRVLLQTSEAWIVRTWDRFSSMGAQEGE